MTDAEPAVTVNDLARDHNLAFVEIIEKVKEGGAINAVFVDATVDADAPDCGFPMENMEYTIKHSTPTGTFFTATAGNHTFRVSPDTATDAFIVSFAVKAGEGSKRPSRSSSKAGTAVKENDLRQRRGAALLSKVAAFANQGDKRGRDGADSTAQQQRGQPPAPVAPVPQVPFDPFHLVTAMNYAKQEEAMQPTEPIVLREIASMFIPTVQVSLFEPQVGQAGKLLMARKNSGPSDGQQQLRLRSE